MAGTRRPGARRCRRRSRPARCRQEPATCFVFCPGCLVVGGPRYADEPEAAARFARHEAFRDWPLVVADGRATPRGGQRDELPLDDLHHASSPAPTSTRPRRRSCATTSASRAPIVIDARMKPWFPAEVSCDPAVAATVTDRWREYFPSGVEMGDSETGHLDPPR